MDVLQVIKDQHIEIKGLFDGLQANKGWQKRQSQFKLVNEKLSREIHFVSEYLIPEVEAHSQGRSPDLNINPKKIGRDLKSLRKACEAKDHEVFARSYSKVLTTVISALDLTESAIFPVIRESIPTADREDLSQVFDDLSDVGYPSLA